MHYILNTVLYFTILYHTMLLLIPFSMRTQPRSIVVHRIDAWSPLAPHRPSLGRHGSALHKGPKGLIIKGLYRVDIYIYICENICTNNNINNKNSHRQV